MFDFTTGRGSILLPYGSQATFLIAFLEGGNEIESRLRETSSSDVEYFQWGIPTIPGLEGMGEKELIALLNSLHAAGSITRHDAVHAWDSAEYIVTWSRTLYAMVEES